MSTIVRFVKGFFGFWYDFVIGDDWVGAAGVLVMIGVTWVLLRSGVDAYWVGPAVIACTAVVLVRRALRRAGARRPV